MYHVFSLLILGFTLLFTACQSSGTKIVIPSYTPPKEVSKLSKIQTKDEFISDGAYLALWINPDIENANQKSLNLTPIFVNSIKEKLTQTNFIAIDPMGDEESVSLNVVVSNYNYSKKETKVSLDMEVTFTLARGVDEFLVKKYRDRKNRMSRDPSKIPTEKSLASQSIEKLVKYFISDISPLKTHQLREFKPFDTSLESVILYAKQKNYDGAITLMRNFNGTKDMNYYYNLAVLYEADASTKEDLSLLRFAKLNYNLAMKNGGSQDELVTNAKSRFDTFYTLLNKTKKQAKANQALMNDRNSMLGNSDDEYE